MGKVSFSPFVGLLVYRRSLKCTFIRIFVWDFLGKKSGISWWSSFPCFGDPCRQWWSFHNHGIQSGPLLLFWNSKRAVVKILWDTLYFFKLDASYLFVHSRITSMPPFQIKVQWALQRVMELLMIATMPKSAWYFTYQTQITTAVSNSTITTLTPKQTWRMNLFTVSGSRRETKDHRWEALGLIDYSIWWLKV